MEQDIYFQEAEILRSIVILELSTQPVSYGIGIINENSSIIVKNELTKTPIKRFMIIKENIDFEKDQKLLHLEEDHLEVVEPNNNKLTKNRGHFAQIFLNFEPQNKYLCSQMYDQDEDAPKKAINYGLVFGIHQAQGSLVSLIKLQFYSNINLSDFQFEQGLIFIEKSSKQYSFYGFCSQMKSFAYNVQFVPAGSSSNQVISSTSLTIKPVSSSDFPYNSIGLLRNQKGGGTAQILFDPKEKTCKFLITCAHNFLNLQPRKFSNLGVDYKQDKKYEGFKFVFCNKFVHQNINFYTCSSTQTPINIKTVHFPRELLKYFKQIQKAIDKKQIKKYNYKIKQSRVENQKAQYQILYQSIYDIAIIELQQAFPISQGFRLRYTPKQAIVKNNIEIVGFPMSSEAIKTTKGVMYHQEAASHPKEEDTISLIRLQGNLQVIQHRLASLPGNSGSPIFENEGKDQAYLFGIHTSGRGQDYISNKQQVKQNQRQIYGTHNIGTYLYNQDVFDWIKTIPGIQAVIDRTTFIYAVGIIEAVINEKQTYILGVFDTNYSILTLAKHFQGQTCRPRRVYIKNSNNYDIDLYKLDIQKKQSYHSFQTEETFQPTINKKIVRILLTTKIQNKQFPDNFVKKTTKDQYKNTTFNSGFIVELGHQVQNEVEINQIPFTKGLPGLQCTGALFVRNQQGQICFDGFYDNGSNTHFTEGAYVSIHENNFDSPKRYVLAEKERDITKFPYNSIGMLILKDKDNNNLSYCTASLLYNHKDQQSRFLITCAGFKIQDMETKEFSYLNGSTLGHQPNRLKVRKIHMPDQYEKYPFQLNISLFELEQPLKIDHGFQISRQQKNIQALNFDHLELAGFPRNESNKALGSLYFDSSKNLPYKILMLKEKKKHDQVFGYINHRFNTMVGHAGSPIYEITEGGAYLLGIHTGKDKMDPNSIVQTNKAIYLYDPKVWKWLQSIPGFEGYFTH